MLKLIILLHIFICNGVKKLIKINERKLKKVVVKEKYLNTIMSTSSEINSRRKLQTLILRRKIRLNL